MVLIAGLIGCILCFRLPALLADGTPFAIFEKHQTSILSQAHSRHEGYLFGVGTARARHLHPASLDAARQKARLEAQGSLADPARRQQEQFPERIRRSGVGERIAQWLKQIETGTVNAIGMQSVYDQCRGQACVAVVAVPAAGLHPRATISWNRIVQYLDNACLRGLCQVSLYDYLEICADNRIDDAQTALVDYVRSRYGHGAAAVVAGKPVRQVPVLWQQGKRFDAEKVSGLDQESLLQLLNMGPYDPVVLYYLAKTFAAQGRHRFAEVLYTRGTRWIIQPEYNRLCLAAIADKDPAGRHQSDFTARSTLRDDIIASFNSSGELPPGLARWVVLSAGTLPLADTATDQDSVVIDRTSIGKIIADHPTPKTFAAVAQLFLERNDLLSALPFARQAAHMNDRYINWCKTIENRITNPTQQSLTDRIPST